MQAPKITTIDEYIAQLPPEVQVRLNMLRRVIKEAAPDATEKMSWLMPTFYLHGNVVHFAAHKKHIGLYPGASGIEAFQHRFTELNWSKGAVQFPMEQPLPFELIGEIVRFRVAENIREAEGKPAKRK